MIGVVKWIAFPTSLFCTLIDENNGSSVERKRPEKSTDDVEATGGAKRRRMIGGEGVTKPTEKEGEGRSKRDNRGNLSSLPTLRPHDNVIEVLIYFIICRRGVFKDARRPF